MPRRGAAGAVVPDGISGMRCFVFFVTFAALVVVAWHHKQVALIAICMLVMLGLGVLGMCIEHLDMTKTVLLFLGIFVFCLVAMKVPDVPSAASRFDTATEESMQEFFRHHVKLHFASMVFSNKSSLVLTVLDDGKGAKVTWPNCFFEKGKKWDPCELEEFIRVELSCRK